MICRVEAAIPAHPLKKTCFRPDKSHVDEIVKEFLIESRENLDRLDRNLVDLEKSPRDNDLLADIFRTIHSIKGTTGFLGFPRLESVAHAGENLLSKLRDGLLVLSPAITNGLLAMVDAIREMLDLIEQTTADGDKDYSELLTLLRGLQENGSVAQSIAPAPAPKPVIAAASPSSQISKPVVEHPPVGHDLSATDSLPVEVPLKASKAKPAEVREAGQQAVREQSAADKTIRVDVALLERLMDLVSELVLTRNQIVQYASSQRDGGFVAVSQKLNLVTTDLREIIMKTRMQPIQNVMGKFPRMVRDVALACEKQVRIELVGQETELDRTLLEAIKDPLTHAVRNAVDHGIEKPQVRISAGKPAQGCLTLRAYHEGGQVNIEVSDDGAGLDPVKIKKKAIEKGLVSAPQADLMKPGEITNLVFQPGFSTAEKVTNVSGRGVGLDVVKVNIEKVGGTVDLQSVPGQGSTLRMKIPLTLAIIPVLIVRSGGQRFAIPQVSLLELVRLEADRAANAIEMVHGAPVYRLRGNLLPLLFLRRELSQDKASAAIHQDDGKLNIVVLQAEGRQFGLVVDEIHDAEEIVVKPLGQLLKCLTVFAGATVMGDGEIALILDVASMAQTSGVLSAGRKAAAQEAAVSNPAVSSVMDKQELLLFRSAQGRRTAIALSSLDRLEEIKPGKFERAGRQMVVQYRGELLPIVNLSDRVDLSQAVSDDDMLNVLVCKHQGQRMGIVVDQILDVAEEAVALEQRWKDACSGGSAVVQEQVTDFLDLETLLVSAQVGLDHDAAGSRP